MSMSSIRAGNAGDAMFPPGDPAWSIFNNRIHIPKGNKQINIILFGFIIRFLFFQFPILLFRIWIMGEINVFAPDETPENLWFNYEFNFLKIDKTENGKEKKTLIFRDNYRRSSFPSGDLDQRLS